MGRMQKAFAWIAVGAIATVVGVRIHTWRVASRPIMVIGAVLRDDRDPAKQAPIDNATITAIGNSSPERTKSDASGLFRLAVQHGLLPGPPVTLRFEHAEYQPRVVTTDRSNRLYVVRLEPAIQQTVVNHTEAPAGRTQIKNVRVRYSLKSQTTINVGSLAKQFEVVNTGNVPCHGQHPCSPDGKWKAAIGRLSFDAQKGNEYRNVRASCIAGPCPFTRLDPSDLSRPARKIEIAALDWSDTTSFLVEAEVTRTMDTDRVLQSYPFITGQTMTFALPPGAEGPSVVADLNLDEIVFPLGPNLILSWATCSVEVAQGGNTIYRCELKPSYQFQQ